MIESRLVSILDQLGVSVLGKNGAGWLVSRCPFAPHYHARGMDRKPSFFVKVDPFGISGFNCFTCKQKGSVSGLVRKLAYLNGENLRELALEAELAEIPDDFGEYERVFQREEAKPIEEEIFVGMYPSAWDVADARDYFRSRGYVSSPKAKHACETLELLYDDREQRILFPVRDSQQNLYGFTGRSILPERKYPSEDYPKVKDYHGLRKDQLLLGEHLFKPDLPILLVEGLFAEFTAVYQSVELEATPMATMKASLSKHQAERLIDFGNPVFLLYDDDLAGDAGLYGPMRDGAHAGGGAVDLLREEIPTSVVAYPADEGKGDVDSWTLNDFRKGMRYAEKF